MKQNLLLISIAIVFKKSRGRVYWFLVKSDEEGEWELPRANVRRVESSVRAAIRTMGEMGGMRAKVLEEVGRAGGSTLVNGRNVSMRMLFYLLQEQESSGEAIGYADHDWLEYAKAVRALGTKRDQEMLRKANKLYKKLEREGRFKKIPEK